MGVNDGLILGRGKWEFAHCRAVGNKVLSSAFVLEISGNSLKR
jgi:hypothetical protein